MRDATDGLARRSRRCNPPTLSFELNVVRHNLAHLAHVVLAGAILGIPQTSWAWYEYERARWMVPPQPSLGIDPTFAREHLRTLQSHGCTDAHTWPLLSALSGLGGDALMRIEALPSLLIDTFSRRKPLFLQLQALQRGCPITPHIDEPGVGGRAIATVVVQGPSSVRVGGVTFDLVAGDMYCLAGDARDSVDHEVYSCAEDRLSVTIRFSGDGPDDLVRPTLVRQASLSL